MISPHAIREVIKDLLGPINFVTAPSVTLSCAVGTESTRWEIARGQLVPPHLTREDRQFENWNVSLTQANQRTMDSFLSVKLDMDRGELHIVRSLLCHVWEGYYAGDNVYLSREVERDVRELVGTVRLENIQTSDELRGELALLLFHAVAGSSRLPLTSVEAPLPAWSLGLVGYFLECGDLSPPLGEEKQRQIAALQNRKLEWLLRSAAVDDVAEAVLTSGQASQDTVAVLRALFNEVSLSPYTDFVDKTLHLLRLLVKKGHLTVEQHVDFLGWLLRQLARHLTAYDLFTFHHRGANYPDALLLDAALKECLRLIEGHTHLFAGYGAGLKRRQALRLAWLHRRRYEGLPVPDAPTSPGENMRVLPPPHRRVPEEQIVNVGKRTKRLYAGDPLPNQLGPNGRQILEQCGRDLQQAGELRALGMAIFIERPLGTVKAPGAPDRSPLLAHLAYSQSLAERALKELAAEPLLGLSADEVAGCRAVLAQPWPGGGIPAHTLPAEPARVVSLADATRAAGDFVILRTLPASVQAFCARGDVAAVLRECGIDLQAGADWLIVARPTGAGKPGVLIRAGAGQQDLQLEVDDWQMVKQSEEEIAQNSCLTSRVQT